MNGNIKMYPMQQIVKQDIAVSLPKCMYTVKNIHHSENGSLINECDSRTSSTAIRNISDQAQNALPELGDIEIRQQKILVQLDELKKQMLTIRSQLKMPLPARSSCNISKPIAKLDLSKQDDILIYCSPLSPPYSLVLVQKLLEHSVEINFQSHIHSTVRELPENAVKLAELLESKSSKIAPVNIRIIWKELEINQLEVRICQSLILGEVNLLRYLSRVIPTLNYETISNCDVDSILDVIYNISRSRSKTERSGYIQTLGKSLGKANDSINGSSLSVADIAAWSALKQIPESEINVTLSKWIKKCDVLVAY